MSVIRVRNPTALLSLELQELIIAALSTYGGLPKDGKGLAELSLTLLELIKNERCALHIGDENGKLCALSVTVLPLNSLNPTPQLAHFYNKGGNLLKRTMRDAIADFMKSSGYTTLRTINMTDAPDSVYARAFWHGGKSKRIGTVMEFSF